MIFEIIDLPRNYPNWRYYPKAPTHYLLRKANSRAFNEVRSDLQTPLSLEIGDCVYFDDRKGALPAEFKKITRGSVIYAKYRKETPEDEIQISIATASSGRAPVIFVS